jgi:hypothetical protein
LDCTGIGTIRITQWVNGKEDRTVLVNWCLDRLHVKIDNLNDFFVGFCFIRSIDR